MAVAKYFTPQSFGPRRPTTRSWRGSTPPERSKPAGRLYHVAQLETDGQIQVFDIWESEEAFTAFGASLMPVLAGQGVDPGAGGDLWVHNVVEG